MRMKNDHMKNGQLKTGFNKQIETENQFFTHYDIYYNPGNTLTTIPFFKGFLKKYKKLLNEACADAGYGSEENYEYMEREGIVAYVKYNYFHKEQKRSFKNNPFIQLSFYYN